MRQSKLPLGVFYIPYDNCRHSSHYINQGIDDVNKYSLEMLEWYDAESDVSWSDPNEVLKWSKKDFLVVEVGFVVYEDQDHIVLASQIGSDGTIGNRTRIPRPWLKSRKRIKADEPKRRNQRDPDSPDSPRRQASPHSGASNTVKRKNR